MESEFVDFLNQCGSPHTTVDAALGLLGDDWCGDEAGILTHNGSAALAWMKSEPDQPVDRIVILASHTDSPCLRSRPNSRITTPEGLELFGVECYGGGLWHTHFDRGMGVAGQVVISKGGGKIEHRNVRIADPVAIVPNLCIHLQSAAEREAFKVNKEDHLRPILGHVEENSKDKKETEEKRTCEDHFPKLLLPRVASELGLEDASQILSWDLCLFDATPARFCGVKNEFIEAPGLDNKSSVFATFTALKAIRKHRLVGARTLYIAIAFDHEEVGSRSTSGADSLLLERWVKGVIGKFNKDDKDMAAVLQRSILISCDAAHAVHPNYASKHQAQHRPLLNKGTVIKMNINQRYATTCTALGVLRQLCMSMDQPLQEFVVRNDSPCGSTIGPLAASLSNIETIDLGIPLLAMHSAREMCGAKDVGLFVEMLKLILLFYDQ